MAASRNLKRFRTNGFQRRAPGAYNYGDVEGDASPEDLAGLLATPEFIEAFGGEILPEDSTDNYALVVSILSPSLDPIPAPTVVDEVQTDNFLLVSTILTF